MTNALDAFMPSAGSRPPPRLSDFAAELVARRRAAGHRAWAELANLLRPLLEHLGELTLDEVDARHGIALARWLQSPESGLDYAPSTLHGIRWAMTAIGEEAVLEGFWEGNRLRTPGRVWPTLRPRQGFEPKTLSPRTRAALLEPGAVQWYRVPLYATALMTGARIGELAALTVADWERDEEPLGALVVSKSYSTRRREVCETKTGAIKRVPVHLRLADILDRWLRHGWPTYIGRPPEPGDLLFPRHDRDGQPQHQAGMLYRFRADLRRSGAPKHRLHDMRHTFIRVAAECGCATDAITSWTHERTWRDARQRYLVRSWPALCAEMRKFRLEGPAS